MVAGTATAAQAAHGVRCGPKRAVGAVAVQACVRRTDGAGGHDRVLLSVRLWNSAATTRTARWQATVEKWVAGRYQFLVVDGSSVIERSTPVPGASSTRVTWGVVTTDNGGQNVRTTSRVTYSAAATWSAWSSVVSPE